MNKTFAGLLCAIAFSVNATPATDASIEQLIVVMKIEKSAAESLVTMQDTFRRVGAQTIATNKNLEKLSDKQKQIFEERMSGMFRLMFDEISWDKTKELYIKAFQKSLTEEEVSKAIAFYSSPEGASFADKQPRIQRDIVEMLSPSVQGMQKKMLAYMAKMAEDMKAADTSKPEKPESKPIPLKK